MPGTFDYWITDRLTFQTIAPKSGSTGDFDRWITDCIAFRDYVEAAEAGATLSISVTPDDSSYYKESPTVV